jgi:hypothetical protein
MWKDLGFKDRSELIKLGVSQGILDLPTIKHLYNINADGGYLKWKEEIAKYKGINIDNDRTYNYQAFFEEDPQKAWDMLKEDSKAHFTDKYKTVWHPTFSDESIYSGHKSKYNPQGIVGGHWKGNTFKMSNSLYNGPVSMDERQQYLINNEPNGASLLESNGTLPVYDGTPWGGVLPTVTITPQYSNGGFISFSLTDQNIFAKGGQMNRAKQAMSFFQSKGLTKEQAAGLVGNFIRESGENLGTTEVNKSSGAYGIAQWLGDRKRALFRKYGSNPSFQDQLNYVWEELNSTHKTGLAKIKNSKTAAEAAANAFGYYEFQSGPKGAIAAMNNSGQNGNRSYNQGIKFANNLLGIKSNASYNPANYDSGDYSRSNYSGYNGSNDTPKSITFKKDTKQNPLLSNIDRQIDLKIGSVLPKIPEFQKLHPVYKVSNPLTPSQVKQSWEENPITITPSNYDSMINDLSAGNEEIMDTPYSTALLNNALGREESTKE